MDQNKKKKLGILLIVIVLIYGVIGFIAIPMIAGRVAPGKLSALLNRPVSMDAVRFNPLTCSAGIRGLSIKEKDGGDFVHVEDIHVDIELLASALTRKPVVKTVNITGPRIRIARDEKGVFNFADIMPKSSVAPPAEPPKTKEETQGLPLFLVQTFNLSGGQFTFSDRSGERPFETVLHPIDIGVQHLTGQEMQRTYFQLNVKTESDESVSLKGEITLADLGCKGRLKLKGIALAKYAPYYFKQILFDVAKGRLNVEADFKHEPGKPLPGGLTCTIHTNLNQLELNAPGEEKPFVAMPGLSVDKVQMDMDRRTIHVAGIAIDRFFAAIKRDKNGLINMAGLFPPAVKKEEVSEEEKGHEETNQPKAEGSGWQFDLDELKIDSAAIQWEDNRIESPATLRIEEIQAAVKGVSNHQNKPSDVRLSMRIENAGHLEMNGNIGLQPFGAEIALVLKDLGLKSFQPYVTEYTNILLTGGTFGIEGNIHVAGGGEKGMDATFEGQTSLTDFGVIEADKTEALIKFKSLWVSDIKAAMNPLDIVIAKVSLTDYVARIVVHPDGSLNLAGIAKHQDGEKTPGDQAKASAPEKAKTDKPETKKPAANIRIDTVTLQGGELVFTDQKIQPRFDTSMLNLGGRISGLSSQKTAPADIELAGTLDNQAPLKITGKINPFIPKPLVDLEITFDDIGLNRFSPYAGKYIGYNLEKGNLFLKLAYELIENKLKGENRVVFDQLTLGDKVESKDALKIPLPLALAIMTDRNGKIELDLPVEGDLDDPAFRLGKQIVKIIVNLLTKMVTSPFAALGSLFGGEDISHLNYSPGISAVDADGIKKLESLAKAMHERPGLKLDIRGAADPEKDAEALKQLRFERRIKSAKRKDLLRQGHPDQPLKQIEVAEEERGLYIKKLFEAAKFPKPRDPSGALKQLPPEEMEKLLYAYVRISEDDLRQLATDRAGHARDEIMRLQPIEAGRLFLVEPNISAAGAPAEKATEKTGLSGVEFTLK